MTDARPQTLAQSISENETMTSTIGFHVPPKDQKPMILWVDQYGQKIWARTIKELREKCGGGKVSKMYEEFKDGSFQVGYGVGSRWFSAFLPMRRPL